MSSRPLFATSGTGFVASSGTTAETVAAIPITVAAATCTKTYDGTATSPVVPTITGGSLAPGDTAVFSETYNNPNVGMGKTVWADGSVNDGDGGNDYVVTFVSNTSGAITPASLTATITAANKVYNGSTVAVVQPTLSGTVFSGDQVSLINGTATFASRNTGAWTVTDAGLGLSGAAAGNYTVNGTATATATITAMPITVAATYCNKVYDGTTTAASLPAITAGSLATGDTAAFSETFDTKNEGVGKTLTPSGSVNDGNGGNNYAVSFASAAAGGIFPRSITVTAAKNTKTYDGTTSAAAAPTITGGSLAPGDTAVFYETYDNASAGTGKTLTPSGSVNDGNNGNNYQVALATNTTGDIIASQVSHFVVTANPASVTAGNNFVLVVKAEDANDNVVTGYAGTVTFTSSDPREPHPAGSVTFTAGSGVAYAVATLQTAGSWAITASDGTYTRRQCPGHGHGGGRRGGRLQPAAQRHARRHGDHPTVTVEVVDPYGNLVTSGSGSTANVTLAIASGPSGGKLLGTTTVAAVGGVATFSTLSIDQAGSYTLSASGAGVGSTATSNPFAITPGPAAKLAFTSQPGPSTPTTRHGDGDHFHRGGGRRRPVRQHGDHRHLQRNALLERGRQRRRRGAVQRQHDRPGHRACR